MVQCRNSSFNVGNWKTVHLQQCLSESFLVDVLWVNDIFRPLTIFEKFLTLGEMKKSVSKLYQMLEYDSVEDRSHKACHIDIGQELDESQWPATNLQGFKMSSNIALREHFKSESLMWHLKAFPIPADA